MGSPSYILYYSYKYNKIHVGGVANVRCIYVRDLWHYILHYYKVDNTSIVFSRRFIIAIRPWQIPRSRSTSAIKLVHGVSDAISFRYGSLTRQRRNDVCIKTAAFRYSPRVYMKCLYIGTYLKLYIRMGSQLYIHRRPTTKIDLTHEERRTMI